MAATGSRIEATPYHNAENGGEESPGLSRHRHMLRQPVCQLCNWRGGFCVFRCEGLRISSPQRSGKLDACPARAAERCQSRADRFVYLRAAQAYMLISMPTGSSTIFGVFQLIRVSQVVWRDVRAGLGPRSGADVTQVRWVSERRCVALTVDISLLD